jgi:hypothetical protein
MTELLDRGNVNVCMYVFIYNANSKDPLQIHFIYLGNKKSYSILSHAAPYVLLPTTAVYPTIVSFFVQIILKFIINHMLKFKSHPCCLKVKGMIRHCSCHHNPTVCACPRGLVLCSNTGPNAPHTHTHTCMHPPTHSSLHYFNPACNIANYRLLGLF